MEEGIWMNWREFLSYSIFSCLSVTLENLLSCAQTPNIPAQDRTLLKGMQIIDAHVHPDRLFPYGGISGWRDKSSTLKAIKKLGMAASSFAAVGDQVYRNPGHLSGSEFESTMAQLESWMKELVEPGLVKLVLKSSDVPKVIDGNSPPGAILAIEGGDPLEGNPDRVSEFYHLGGHPLEGTCQKKKILLKQENSLLSTSVFLGRTIRLQVWAAL